MIQVFGNIEFISFLTPSESILCTLIVHLECKRFPSKHPCLGVRKMDVFPNSDPSPSCSHQFLLKIAPKTLKLVKKNGKAHLAHTKRPPYAHFLSISCTLGGVSEADGVRKMDGRKCLNFMSLISILHTLLINNLKSE